MRFFIAIEKTRTGFSAYSPDLNGCVAAARTRPAVKKLMKEAIALHVEDMREDGRRIPKPSATYDFVTVET